MLFIRSGKARVNTFKCESWQWAGDLIQHTLKRITINTWALIFTPLSWKEILLTSPNKCGGRTPCGTETSPSDMHMLESLYLQRKNTAGQILKFPYSICSSLYFARSRDGCDSRKHLSICKRHPKCLAVSEWAPYAPGVPTGYWITEYLQVPSRNTSDTVIENSLCWAIQQGRVIINRGFMRKLLIFMDLDLLEGLGQRA